MPSPTCPGRDPQRSGQIGRRVATRGLVRLGSVVHGTCNLPIGLLTEPAAGDVIWQPTATELSR